MIDLSTDRLDALAHDDECVLYRARREEDGSEVLVLATAVQYPGPLNKQIAGELVTTERTIKFHRANIMRKMQAESVADLVKTAQKLGWENRK